jgi:ferredoxin
MGEKCKQTEDLKTCFTLGRAAQFMVDKGVGTILSKEEMISRITRAEEQGMVLQPANNQDPDFICCCCGCCCGVLTTFKKYENPAEMVHTNFHAEIDIEDCTGCEECIEVCPMEALISVNSHTEVRMNRCIGCGVCVGACTSNAISLRKKEKETVPPQNGKEMYKKMIIDRYGVRGAIEFMGKAALGKKI